MDMYLYCSYEHSDKGFFLTRMEEKTVRPCSLSHSSSKGKRLIHQFFNNDCFNILWLETMKSNRTFPPYGNDVRITGGIFLIRNLQGSISDRRGIANFAVYAREDELSELNAAALNVLKNKDYFTEKLFSYLSVGGEYGYEADCGAIRDLLSCHSFRLAGDEPSDAAKLLLKAAEPHKIITGREVMRFGVLSGSWQSALEFFHPSLVWRSCPSRVIDEEKFRTLFGGRDILLSEN